MHPLLSTVVLPLTLLALAATPTAAVVAEQIDDFQDGTTQDWREGPVSPNPPVNVPNGGPTGAGDAYLSNSSSGRFGAGGRQIMYNGSQWTGDYVAAGVVGIEVALANFGDSTVQMRVFLGGAVGGVGSTAAVPVLPGGTWTTVYFSLEPADLTLFVGTGPIEDVLATVQEARILAAADGPAFMGDAIFTTMGYDNLRAVSVPIPALPTSWGALKLGF